MRKSVSAVMARLPSTISLTRRGDTPMARARAVCDRAIGLRNSSSRISPGRGFGRCALRFNIIGDACRLRHREPVFFESVDVKTDGVANFAFDSLYALAGRHAAGQVGHIGRVIAFRLL